MTQVDALKSEPIINNIKSLISSAQVIHKPVGELKWVCILAKICYMLCMFFLSTKLCLMLLQRDRGSLQVLNILMSTNLCEEFTNPSAILRLRCSTRVRGLARDGQTTTCGPQISFMTRTMLCVLRVRVVVRRSNSWTS